jgi:hypothetical protein
MTIIQARDVVISAFEQGNAYAVILPSQAKCRLPNPVGYKGSQMAFEFVKPLTSTNFDVDTQTVTQTKIPKLENHVNYLCSSYRYLAFPPFHPVQP